MEGDPLRESAPPRHAVESDEEEDEFNPLRTDSTRLSPSEIGFKFIGEILENAPLIIGTGRPGQLYAKGAGLGEQTGGIYVNGKQVGLVFKPTWVEANVLISEVLTQLPLDFMGPYAKYVAETLKPTKASLLDSYSFPQYSSSSPLSFPDAPVRYLSAASEEGIKAEPFQPPNLLQGTSAALILQLRIQTIPSTILLLPSPQIPVPPPKKLLPSHVPSEDHADNWPSATLIFVGQQLLAVLHLPTDNFSWDYESAPRASAGSHTKPTREVGEGSMYI